MAEIMLWINDESGSLAETVSSLSGGNNGNKAQQLVQLQNLLTKVFQSPGNSAMLLNGDTVEYASGTLTLGAVVATNTCSVFGTTFTAVASGATGQQFNVGGTPTLTAVNLKNVINTTFGGSPAVATSDGAVVTITAIDFGESANAFPIAGGTNITASGSFLSGGVSPSWSVVTGVDFS